MFCSNWKFKAFSRTFFIVFREGSFKESWDSLPDLLWIETLCEIKFNRSKHSWDLSLNKLLKSRHEFRIFKSFFKSTFLFCFFIIFFSLFNFNFLLLCFSWTFWILSLLWFWLSLLSCFFCFFFKISFQNIFFLLNSLFIFINIVSWLNFNLAQ